MKLVYMNLPIGIVKLRQTNFIITPTFVNSQAEAMFGLSLEEALRLTGHGGLLLARLRHRARRGARIRRAAPLTRLRGVGAAWAHRRRPQRDPSDVRAAAATGTLGVDLEPSRRHAGRSHAQAAAPRARRRACQH